MRNLHPMQMERFEVNEVMQMQILQHYWISNKQSLSYRMSWFKRRFFQYGQHFCVTIIKWRSSDANSIMQVLMTEPCLCNLESNYSKLIGMFIKLCVTSVCSLSAVCLQSVCSLSAIYLQSVCNLCAMSRALAPSFHRNLMITLWSYSSQSYF
jgi:hypothetical protein